MLIINGDKQSARKIKHKNKKENRIEIKVERKMGRGSLIVGEPFDFVGKKKTHLHMISIKKQETKTFTVATPRLELLQFTCFQGPFGRAFHFFDTPVPLENPLMTVTRVILKQELSQRRLRNEKSGSDN